MESGFNPGSLPEKFKNGAEANVTSEMVQYVQSHLKLTIDGKAASEGRPHSWPAPRNLLAEDDMFLTLSWPLARSAQKMEVSFSLFQSPTFSPFFEVHVGRNGKGFDVFRVPAQKKIIIPLSSLESPSIDPPNKMAIAQQFIRLGFTHILPKGLDHILFVIGLFLLSPKFKPLLLQITAFTLAHSLTLALSILGLFTFSTRLVEPVIALSISFIALENILQKRVSPWRWLVVFGFGLIHGLGFASVLTEISLPENSLGWALICFNVGVELGQISVVGIVFLLTFWMRERSWYVPYIRNPVCILIGMIGFYWTMERLLTL